VIRGLNVLLAAAAGELFRSAKKARTGGGADKAGSVMARDRVIALMAELKAAEA
jgi:hypothetical protein